MSLKKKGVYTNQELQERHSNQIAEKKLAINDKKKQLKEKSKLIQESLCDVNGNCELDLTEL